MAESLAELRAAEREVARECEWLHEVEHGVARLEHPGRTAGQPPCARGGGAP
jgi:hypothetical protein